jgi:hypothetical protein
VDGTRLLSGRWVDGRLKYDVARAADMHAPDAS